MGAIPQSDMPGYKQLYDLVNEALGLCREWQGVDFKESQPWKVLQWKIISAVLGMGNLRDGGIIIIGVSERSSSWDLTGIDPAHLATYDVDVIADQVSKYVSPPVSLNIVTHRYPHNGKEFLIIQINEFEHTPLVCKKNGPDGEGIIEGAVYVRPPGKPQTTRVTNAAQMHDLLDLAAEKRARKMIEAARRMGIILTGTPADQTKFDEELEGL